MLQEQKAPPDASMNLHYSFTTASLGTSPAVPRLGPLRRIKLNENTITQGLVVRFMPPFAASRVSPFS